MITKLKNPITPTYIDFKNYISRETFEWNHAEASWEGANPGFFSHPFIIRPFSVDVAKFPKMVCKHTMYAHQVIEEILDFNNITLNCIYRMNLNKTYPLDFLDQQTPVHVDHEFPHSNLLIYFTSHKEGEGGQIIVNDEHYFPEEDDVITFPGTPHSTMLPKKGFRVSMVTTYLGGYTRGPHVDKGEIIRDGVDA